MHDQPNTHLIWSYMPWVLVGQHDYPNNMADVTNDVTDLRVLEGLVYVSRDLAVIVIATNQLDEEVTLAKH